MRLRDIETPALVLDRGRLSANIARMAATVRRHGVRLRPHMKTAKSADVARMVLAEAGEGVTVSTLREAEYFFDAGIRDIAYAVGLVPGKLDRALALKRRGADLSVLTDNLPVARHLAEAVPPGTGLEVLVEVDVGEGRGGVSPDSPELTGIARTIDAAPGLVLAGVLAHAGHSYKCRSLDEVAAVAEAERAGAVAAAARIRRAGPAAPVVSVGSTPTALHARDLSGVSEVRPGVYMFGDLFQAGIGSCTADDIAVTVLAAVIGHRPESNTALIDAGSLALSQDRSTAALDGGDAGYGLVAGIGGRPMPGLFVRRVNQEHGYVTADAPLPFDRLPIGGRVRILPNHACITSAMHDRYRVIDGGDEIVAEWPRVNGW